MNPRAHQTQRHHNQSNNLNGHVNFHASLHPNTNHTAPLVSKKVKIPVRTAEQDSLLAQFAAKVKAEKNQQFTASSPVPVRLLQPNLPPNHTDAQQFQNFSQFSAPQTPYNQANTQSFIPQQRHFANQNQSNQSFLPSPSNSLFSSVAKKPNQKLYYDEPAKKINFKLFDISNIRNYFVKILQINPVKLLKIKKLKLIRSFGVASVVILIVLSFGNSFLQNKLFPKNNAGAVAGALENKSSSSTTSEYKTWIQEKNNGKYSPPDDDIDKDGLTNNEEFTLGSSPVSANTCDKNNTDSQNLINLIDPASCKNIDTLSSDQFAKFSKVINIAKIQQQFTQNTITPTAANSTEDSDFLKIFGVTNYDQISKLSPDSIKQQAEISQTKISYLNTINKIDKYISKYRSYEPYDRDYPSPVSSAKYLEVSIEYGAPLKYVLALARNESRFGTDRFDKDGNLTRPGQYQNIYSIGLTDGGSNLSFGGWDKGVEAFGKWYKKFQDKGVPDCRKWSIYNPNGDYCGKIEELAGEIEAYLNN